MELLHWRLGEYVNRSGELKIVRCERVCRFRAVVPALDQLFCRPGGNTGLVQDLFFEAGLGRYEPGLDQFLYHFRSEFFFQLRECHDLVWGIEKQLLEHPIRDVLILVQVYQQSGELPCDSFRFGPVCTEQVQQIVRGGVELLVPPDTLQCFLVPPFQYDLLESIVQYGLVIQLRVLVKSRLQDAHFPVLGQDQELAV